MSSQAFLDGYLSKEAGVGDWIKTKLRNFGAARNQPAQNFGSAEGADYMRAGNLTKRYSEAMRAHDEMSRRIDDAPRVNERMLSLLGRRLTEAETARQALKAMPAQVVRPDLR